MRTAPALAAIVASLVGGACKSELPSAAVVSSYEAVKLERHHECAACGMIVIDQPAPRAQLVHRDGTRLYFCSISDLVAYLDTPTPHGAVMAIYVEALEPSADPAVESRERHPWIAAPSASYVIGIARPRVMGDAVMVYASGSEAHAAVDRIGGELVAWPDLRARLLGH